MPGLGRLVKQLRNEDWLSPKLDAAIETESEHWGDPSHFVRPSSAGGACPLDLEYAMLGHRTGFNARSRRRMDNGTAAHVRWEKYFKDAGLLEAGSQGLVYPMSNGGWRGETDLIALWSEYGTLHLGEIKTMNQWRYKRVPDQVPDFKKMAHVMLQAETSYTRQVTQYLVKFQEAEPDKYSDDIFFLFENTDNQDYRIIWMRPDEWVREDAFKLAAVARSAAEEGRLLDPPFEQGSSTCRSCYRETMCYKVQGGEEEPWQKIRQALSVTSGR